MIQQTIQPLVLRTASGDHDAFEQLLRSQKDLIYWIIRKMCDCPEDAEDIHQEVSIRVFQNISSLKYPEAFGAWLRSIVLHECVRFLSLKKKHISIETIAEWENLFADHDADCNPLARVEKLELRGALKSTYDSLKEPIQKMVNMRLGMNMRCSEIAEIIDVKAGTVSVALHRAKERLRKKLRSGGIDT